MQFTRSAVGSVLALFLGGLSGCSVQESATETVAKTWWVKDLAMFSNPRVTVTDEEEKPLGRLSTRALRNLSRAKIGVTEASGLYSELIVVEGAAPDAFAGFFQSGAPGVLPGTPAIVMSIGLVALLERDTDAAAYLMAHETAHLLKGHVAAAGTRDVLLRRIRVLTEAGANHSARPATDATLFTVSSAGAPYSEAQEREAHEAGMRYATAAGYDPAAAARLERMLGAAPPPGSSPARRQHSNLSGALR